ncbi:hypothetical protein ABE132_11155 [Peribacillus simplex]|uniref:hypothetical protein n=1 Tax=Peribacillus simplex TaxID=1478 RepID=UPI003D2D4073
MEPVSYLKDMLGVTEGSVIDTTIDVGVGAAPYLGKVYQSYQMMKLQKRVKTHEKQLQILKNKIETSENEVFYKQEVFPLIVKKLMDDDEDNKSKVIIDGFEYVIDNELKEIERIYHYYDVLSELRYSDIMMLVDEYMPFEMRKYLKLNINLKTEEEMRSAEYKEELTINAYQKNKMVRLGLLENKVENIEKNKKMSQIREITVITDFGKRFLIFFSMEDTPEEQVL